jgi:hypothetical protein
MRRQRLKPLLQNPNPVNFGDRKASKPLSASGRGQTHCHFTNSIKIHLSVNQARSPLYDFSKLAREIVNALIPQPLLPILGEGEQERKISLKN